MKGRKKELFDYYFRTFIDRVSSTNIKRVKYDSVTKDLTVEFESGDVYIYSNVPEKIYDNIVEGQAGTKTSGVWGGKGKYPSVGASVHQYLVEGNFRYRKSKVF